MATQTKSTSKTVFTTTDLEIVATRVFDAPRPLVWSALTDPKHIPQWMLGPDGWTMPICEVDLRPGGAWHFAWKNESGELMEMRGTYREIVPPSRIVNTENWGGDFAETINTYELTEKDGKTTVVSSVVYPSKEARDKAMQTGMLEGWGTSFDRLESYLLRI